MEKSANSTSSPTIATHKGRNKRTIYILVIIIVISLLVAGIFYTLSNRPAQYQVNPNAVFIGAYSTYAGKTTILGQTITMQLREEITNLTNAKVEILSQLAIKSTLFGNLYEYHNTTWLDLGSPNFYFNNLTLINKSESNITFPGVGSRDCIIYEYNFKPNNDLEGTITMYADKSLGWAYKFDCDFSTSEIVLDISLPLQETNVSGLK